jgi:hypothetical protein
MFLNLDTLIFFCTQFLNDSLQFVFIIFDIYFLYVFCVIFSCDFCVPRQETV